MPQSARELVFSSVCIDWEMMVKFLRRSPKKASWIPRVMGWNLLIKCYYPSGCSWITIVSGYRQRKTVSLPTMGEESIDELGPMGIRVVLIGM